MAKAEDEPLTEDEIKQAVADYVASDEFAGDAFHAHLDECEQCRNRPHNLCSVGESLLRTGFPF